MRQYSQIADDGGAETKLRCYHDLEPKHITCCQPLVGSCNPAYGPEHARSTTCRGAGSSVVNTPTVADQILRHMEAPAEDLWHVLHADSLATPGGTWKAAAALQAALSNEEMALILTDIRGARRGVRQHWTRRKKRRQVRGRSRYRNNHHSRTERKYGGMATARTREQMTHSEEITARQRALGLDMDAHAALNARADTLRQQILALRKAQRDLWASEADSTRVEAREKTVMIHTAIRSLMDDDNERRRRPPRYRR